MLSIEMFLVVLCVVAWTAEGFKSAFHTRSKYLQRLEHFLKVRSTFSAYFGSRGFETELPYSFFRDMFAISLISLCVSV